MEMVKLPKGYDIRESVRRRPQNLVCTVAQASKSCVLRLIFVIPSSDTSHLAALPRRSCFGNRIDQAVSTIGLFYFFGAARF